MENELREILEQLHSLTNKVERLLAECERPAGDLDCPETSEASESPEPSGKAEIFETPEPSGTPEPIEAPGNPETHEEVAVPPLPAAIRFSINDRFRFQRAIFGNSPERMANAMSAISAMTTADEVYAYLTNVLQRDVDDPDVEDFFREVTLRFSDHKPLII